MALLETITASILLWSLFVSFTIRVIVPDKSSILFSKRLLSALSVLSTLCCKEAVQPERINIGSQTYFIVYLFIIRLQNQISDKSQVTGDKWYYRHLACVTCHHF